MIRIEVHGDMKSGKTSVAALIYSLLGDHGLEATVVGYDSTRIHQLSREEPVRLSRRMKVISRSNQRVELVVKQLPRKAGTK